MQNLSVIIPTFGRDSLHRCIDSIIRQTTPPHEIVVVDNSNGLFVKKLIKELLKTVPIPLKYVREPKKGASHSRNTGFNRASNPLLAFIDDDCRALPTWLEEMVKIYSRVGPRAIIKGRSENGSPDNLISSVQHVGDEMFFRTGYLTDGKHIYSQWLDTKNALIPKTLFTKERLKFNKYRIFEDLDFSIQAVKSNVPVYYCHDAVVYHEGRSDLIRYFFRQIQKGRDYRLIKSRALTPQKALNFSTLEKKYFSKLRHWRSEREIKDGLMRTALKNKNALFRFGFAILKKAGELLVHLTYRYTKTQPFV